ncbi:hypothetical protein ACT3TS_06910 [Specibacter sp. AOP5-B1-6]
MTSTRERIINEAEPVFGQFEITAAWTVATLFVVERSTPPFPQDP